MRRFLIALLFLVAPALYATNYCIDAAAANDSDTGAYPGHCKRNWSAVLNTTVLAPGNTLYVISGTYPTATYGAPSITCGTNAQNGMPLNGITIRAETERGAHITTTGATVGIKFDQCSYYTVQGLWITGGDAAGSSDGLLWVRRSSHMTIRRNLVDHSNRSGNFHCVAVDDFNNGLIEENDIEYCHRHGLYIGRYPGGVGSSNNEIRRNYLNSQNYANIPAYSGGQPDRGDEGLSCYACFSNVFENNVLEKWTEAMTINASSQATDNKYYGNIVYDTMACVWHDARSDDLAGMPQNNQMFDTVCIGNNAASVGEGFGVWMYGVKTDAITRMSMFTDRSGQGGYRLSIPGTFPTGTQQGDGDNTASIADSIFMRTSLSNGTGVSNEDPETNCGQTPSCTSTLTVTNTVSFGYGTAFTPSVGVVDNTTHTNTSTSDPGMGTCRLWAPDGSSAATNGRGATVLRATEGSILQNDSQHDLWSHTTGAPQSWWVGATVAGTNDVTGSSLYDIQNRFNIKQNGCTTFPIIYDPTPTPSPTSTNTPTFTPSNTSTATNTPTFTPTGVLTNTPTRTPSNTPTVTPTPGRLRVVIAGERKAKVKTILWPAPVPTGPIPRLVTPTPVPTPF